MRAAIARRLELVQGFDAFGDDPRPQIHAQPHDVAYEHPLPRIPIESGDQGSIELYDLGFEIRNALQVGLAGAQVIDDQMGARTRTDLFQDPVAKVEVREGRGFGDFEVHVAVMEK